MTTRRYDQRLRAEQAEDTRRRILEAAGAQLRAAPRRPVALDRVAQEARVARSTIYQLFGSRAGLFDAVAEDVWNRAGIGRLISAVDAPDAREHLRGALRAGVEVFAEMRDLARVLFSTNALEGEALGGAIGRIEENRAGGNAYLANRLAEQDLLRPDTTVEEATNVLWLLSSFDSFDALYTGRGLGVDETAATLVATAERTLLRP